MTQVPRTVLSQTRLQNVQYVQSQKGPVHCKQSGFPVQWWPCAARCFYHSMDIAVVDGDSACNKRQGVEFDGFSIPYGCLVDFRPPNVVLKKAANFGTTSMPGIFIGYIQHIGGKWAHVYFACPLEDFQIENASHTCRIFRIREVRNS